VTPFSASPRAPRDNRPLAVLSRQRKSLPPAAWVLFGGTFINRFGTFVIPFLILYLTRIGYSSAQAGLAVGAYGIGHLIASSAGGHLADRIGRRNTIVLSMFGSAASMLALSQARSYVPIVILTCITGSLSELYRPASYALVGDLVGQEHRVTAFGIYRLAINLGFAAGPATAGFLADHSFTLLFIGDAATSVIYGIIALFALPHGLRTYVRTERTGEALRVAARDKPFILFLLATLCITTVDFQLGSTFALHVRAAGFPSRVYGLLVSMNGMLIVVFELGITQWTRRFQARPIIALGYLLAGIGFALTGLAHTIPLLAATVVVWTLGEMISSPVATAYAVQLAPEQYRGRYLGLVMMMWSLGMVIGPPAGTFLFDRNPAAVWIACAALGIISAALMMRRRS
jgi:MFS family permease